MKMPHITEGIKQRGERTNMQHFLKVYTSATAHPSLRSFLFAFMLDYLPFYLGLCRVAVLGLIGGVSSRLAQ